MHVRLIAAALLLGTSAAWAEIQPDDQPILFELHVQRSQVEVLPRGSEAARFSVDASTAVQTSGGVQFSSLWSIDRDSLYLNVTDQDIQPSENANPVVTLRMRYDAWKRGGA